MKETEPKAAPKAVISPGFSTQKIPREAAPQRCVTMAELVATAGGILRPGAAAEVVRYPVPPHATAEVRAYWQSRTEARSVAQFWAELPEGRVFGAGIVLSPDGTCLARDVAGDLGKPWVEHWLLDYDRLRAPDLVVGSVAVVAVNLGAGYAHWLLEELPRLLAVPKGAADQLWLHAQAPYAQAALAWRAGPERVLEARRAAHGRVGPLWVPSLVDAPGVPTARARDRILEFTADVGRDLPRAGEKIYLTRQGAARRRVVAEPALRAWLEAGGFTTVAAENLTWAEQIAVFRHARVIVAPHGAGLANLVFCAPGTRVVEGFDRAYLNPVFGRVAALGQLDYRPVVSAGEGPVREETTAGRRDIAFDLAALAAALAD